MQETKEKTHFGFEEVEWSEKANKVAEVFESVAPKYDRMNDLMSLGIHRLWKRYAVEVSGVRKGHQVLDLAGGTGDLTAQFAQIVGQSGRVILSDINPAMLDAGRKRLIDKGIFKNVECVLADAQSLPFANNQFDIIIIGFGLRNVTDKAKALSSMYEKLKPGGCCLVLEFSHPTSSFVKPFYDFYSFKVLPKMGQLVAKDGDSYRYLAESIRMHPKQDELKEMMETAGFEDCSYQNLTFGIVSLHRGYKY